MGKSDIIINIDNQEYVIETKIYSGEKQFETGKQQLAYYAESLELKKAIYIVYMAKQARKPATIKAKIEKINDVEISTFLIEYDDTKW